VLGIVLVFIVLRAMGRRNSVFMAILLSIFIPLLCMLTAYYMQGGWSRPQTGLRGYSNGQFYDYSREFRGPWIEINYARWLLGPLFGRYSRYTYYGMSDFTAVQFGFAQTVAAIWLFSLALKNLDFMLGRPSPGWRRWLEAAESEGRADGRMRPVLGGGLPLAERIRDKGTFGGHEVEHDDRPRPTLLSKYPNQ